jgi:hypothetical protein
MLFDEQWGYNSYPKKHENWKNAFDTPSIPNITAYPNLFKHTKNTYVSQELDKII